MKTKKLRFLALLLSVLLMASMLPPAAFADEPADELTQETIDRVYDEVLTGEITSTEDVLRVALAQYEARQTTTYGMRSVGSITENEDEVPRITQVIESTLDKEGNTISFVADTALLVTDEEGNMVTLRHANQDFIVLNDYNITAQHTVYYYHKFPLYEGDNAYVKIYKQVTTLQNNSTYLANKIRHEYRPFEPDSGGYVTRYKQTFYTPVTGTYTTYPNPAEPYPLDWVISYYGDPGGFESVVYIYCGTKYYTFGNVIKWDTVDDSAFNW